MHREREAAPSPALDGQLGASTSLTCAILVVEDDNRTIKLEQFILQGEGFEVEAAASGEEALEILRRSRANLVVLDINLPGISGLDTCRRIREFSRVPILMVTGRAGELDEMQGLEAGADDYIAKPFSPNVLVARVKASLRRAEFGNLPEPQGPGRVLMTAERTGQAACPQPPASVGNRPEPQPAEGVEGMYEGNVRLVVEADGSTRQMMEFMDELCQNQQVRLLQMVANQLNGNVNIWLGLREPVALLRLLRQLTDVATVAAAAAAPGEEPLFSIALRRSS